MASRKTTARPKPAKKKPTLKQLYAKLRKEFTAADVQKYTEIEKGIPLEQVIAGMRKIHEEEMQKLKKQKGGAR